MQMKVEGSQCRTKRIILINLSSTQEMKVFMRRSQERGDLKREILHCECWYLQENSNHIQLTCKSIQKQSLGSNSSTSLANENENFILYSSVVIDFSNLSTCKWACLLRTQWAKSLNSILQSHLNFSKPIGFEPNGYKLSQTLSLKLHFDFLNFCINQ